MNKVLIFKNTFRLNLQKKTTRIAFGILGYEKLNLVIQSNCYIQVLFNLLKRSTYIHFKVC